MIFIVEWIGTGRSTAARRYRWAGNRNAVSCRIRGKDITRPSCFKCSVSLRLLIRCRRKVTRLLPQLTAWREIYGHELLYGGPLFMHQLSHLWIDFRGIQDEFMRVKRIDYFENSRRATYMQQEYAIHNPREFKVTVKMLGNHRVRWTWSGAAEHRWGGATAFLTTKPVACLTDLTTVRLRPGRRLLLCLSRQRSFCRHFGTSVMSIPRRRVSMDSSAASIRLLMQTRKRERMDIERLLRYRPGAGGDHD